MTDLIEEYYCSREKRLWLELTSTSLKQKPGKIEKVTCMREGVKGLGPYD
jgi:hypothetical protein